MINSVQWICPNWFTAQDLFFCFVFFFLSTQQQKITAVASFCVLKSYLTKNSCLVWLGLEHASSASLAEGVAVCPAGASLPPGTHTIPLSQLQTHSLAIQCPQTQNSHAMTSTTTAAAVPAHTQPAAQATLFRLPATVSLTGQCVSYSLCVLPCWGKHNTWWGPETCF